MSIHAYNRRFGSELFVDSVDLPVLQPESGPYLILGNRKTAFGYFDLRQGLWLAEMNSLMFRRELHRDGFLNIRGISVAEKERGQISN